MVYANDFSDMMNAKLTLAPFVSRDVYGVPTFGTAVQYNCRRFKKNKLVRNASGQEVTSTAQVWILGNPTVTAQDQIILLSDGSKPIILSVDSPDDETGTVAFTKVYFL